MNPTALRDYLAECREHVAHAAPVQLAGRLTRINGLVMEASGLKLPLGSGCQMLAPGGVKVEAEVVGFNGERLFMMPTEDVFGLAPGALVVPRSPPSNRPASAKAFRPSAASSTGPNTCPWGKNYWAA